MWLCYLDESGCPGVLPSATSQVQPVLTIVGVLVKLSKLKLVTDDLLRIKGDYFPKCRQNTNHHLDQILYEIKGSEVRKSVRSNRRREFRHALGFLDRVLDLLELNETKLIGRVWIKPIGGKFDGTSVYTSSVQHICKYFQNFLKESNDNGLIIADSRTKKLNQQVSHSIFTMKYKHNGDSLSRIIEMPVFGHSDNHAGLQISDFVNSSLIFPTATFTYCTNYINSVHVDPNYRRVKERYAERLKALQYRYKQAGEKYIGGITVSDAISKRSGSLMFR